MLERPLEYLIGELVAGARSAGGKVTHVLEHGVEAHARLLTQLILNNNIQLVLFHMNEQSLASDYC